MKDKLILVFVVLVLTAGGVFLHQNTKKLFPTQTLSPTPTPTPTPSPSPAPTPQTGTIAGTVTLSPTCPVERVPPYPGCAPKGYAINIFIFNSAGVNIKEIKSDAEGYFQTQLPEGRYTLDAKETYLPRCSPVEINVTSNTVTRADISCDTGIR
jgi:hypothetical protein